MAPWLIASCSGRERGLKQPRAEACKQVRGGPAGVVGSDPVQSPAGGSIAEAFRAHLVSSGARRPRAGEELASRRREESLCDLECEEPLNHSADVPEAYGHGL